MTRRVKWQIGLYFAAFWAGVALAGWQDNPAILVFVCLGLGCSLFLPVGEQQPAVPVENEARADLRWFRDHCTEAEHALERVLVPLVLDLD